MGRLFLVITGPILIILLIDSALHDPDVHPVVSAGVTRAANLIDGIPGWHGGDAGDIQATTQSGSARAASGATERTHSALPGWYWSTILAVAATCLGLIKIALTVTFRNRSAEVSRESKVDPAPGKSGP